MDCNENNSYYIYDYEIAYITRNSSDNIMIAYLQPALMILGLILNIAFLFVVYKSKAMKSITNIYLANLALSDVIHLADRGVIRMAEYYWSPLRLNVSFYRIGVLGCSVDAFISYTTYFTSLFIVGAVSVERFLAICYPLKHRSIASSRRTWKIVCACWFSASVFGGYNIIDKGDYFEECYSYSETYSYIPELYGICHQFPIGRGVYPWLMDYSLDFTTFSIVFIGKITGPPLVELVNISVCMAFWFHFVFKGRACSLTISIHCLNTLQASPARVCAIFATREISVATRTRPPGVV